MAKLKANVWVGGQLHRAGSTPPPEAAERIRNPKVWADDPDVRDVDVRKRDDAFEIPANRQAVSLEQVQEPPRGGAGSGADVWRQFLTDQGVEDLPAEANRDDLVALWDARKIQG